MGLKRLLELLQLFSAVPKNQLPGGEQGAICCSAVFGGFLQTLFKGAVALFWGGGGLQGHEPLWFMNRLPGSAHCLTVN